MPVEFPKLPYDLDALEPHMSERTLSYHYGKHHQGYVEKLNAGIKGTDYEGLPLEDIVRRSRAVADLDILNNAAQAWNHEFFWNSLSPNSDSPDGRILKLIESRFESVDEFQKQFRDAATGLFGSGWVWLVLEQGHLRIITTGNADSPVGTHLTPLLTLDVWEHAYYLDFQNARGKFIDAFLDKLINWEFAQANLDAAELTRAA